ncbi:arylsulfatase B-like protein [Tribonema minus]|uniref:Arylsulfatase B-like protein n=1 Tax=Tribonema minus TaxID=303371 RepID=A0A836CML6_9STRA|nr:arylsulfatase B-like protein [Tribonema minus]
MLDDWGWNNWGVHAHGLANNAEVRTPELDKLAAAGLILDRHYTAPLCSPTRAAFQTGRNPIHVDSTNGNPARFNATDRVSGFEGIPTNMTVIAEKMSSAGYAAHFVGKWHVGHSSRRQLPKARGYSTFLGYFNAGTNYWKYTVNDGICRDTKVTVMDMWAHNATTEGPAFDVKPPATCNTKHQSGCVYVDELLQERASDIILAHDKNQPLFLVYAPHAIHSVLSPPAARLQEFASIGDSKARRNYAATVADIDTRIGALVSTLKAQGMWDNSLIIVMSDNGGPISSNGGASNYPLRGGKYGSMEGGVRTNAFITGGRLPAKQIGKVASGLVAVEDWYATFCALGRADPTDTKAQKAGLPPVDSINMWPYLSGQVSAFKFTGDPVQKSPRKEVTLGFTTGMPLDTVAAQAVIDKNGYKLIVGDVTPADWSPQINPTGTTSASTKLKCGDRTQALMAPYTGACLFNVFSDPSERQNLAADVTKLPIIQRLAQRLVDINKTVFAPKRGPDTQDDTACQLVLNKWAGSEGPWLE